MALVSCPECAKEVSDSAESCPNCGFAVKKHFEEEKDETFFSYCPKCAAIKIGLGIESDKICGYCKTPVVFTDMDWDTFLAMNKEESNTWEQKIFDEFIKDNPLYDPQAHAKTVAEDDAFRNNMGKSKAKCPTCGSTNIQKIGGLERAVSVGVLGVFSKKINKSFKCGHCGYTW